MKERGTYPPKKYQKTELLGLIKQEEYPRFRWQRIPSGTLEDLKQEIGFDIKALWKIPKGNPSSIVRELSQILRTYPESPENSTEKITVLLITHKESRPTWSVELLDMQEAKEKAIRELKDPHTSRVRACLSLGQVTILRNQLKEMYLKRRGFFYDHNRWQKRPWSFWKRTSPENPKVYDYLKGIVHPNQTPPEIKPTDKVWVKLSSDGTIRGVNINGIFYDRYNPSGKTLQPRNFF